MAELWSNPKPPEEPFVSINKGYRISFNVYMVKKYNLEDCKYCYITKPEMDRKSIKVGFVFTKDATLFNVSPSKLSKHPSSFRFQISPKRWFTEFNIDPSLVAGNYPAFEKTDPKIGKVYWITLSKE